LRQQVDINLADETTAHALIAGATGSGKTVLMQSILLQLARQNPPDKLHILGIDGKMRGLLPFQDLAHLVHPIIMEPDEAVQALAWAVEEMERRKRAPDEKPPHLLIAIDEIAGIINRTGGPNGKVAGSLAYLAQEGRELGIHLLLATQHPVQDVLGGALGRANLTARFLFKVVDTSASKLVSGVADAGGEKLLGRGDCVLVAAGDKQRFQVALPAQADFDNLPRGSTGRIDLSRYANANGDTASPTAERADPLTPQQIGWVLANGVPGINTIAKQFGMGNPKATRLQQFCIGIMAELKANRCGIYEMESEEDDDGPG
jgi:S-DNA-T family DNA segregation ATPase FtsK/SpoIIIE